MKKFLLALVLLLTPTLASAQCTGVFPPNTLCGNLDVVPAPPGPVTSGGTVVVGPSTSVVGDWATWNNLTGTLLASTPAIFAPYILNNTEVLLDTVNAFTVPYTSSAVSENWGIDGFRIYCAGGTPGAFAIQAVNNVSLAGNLTNALWLRPVTTNTAPTAGDNCHIEQWIYPPRLLLPLQMGTANSRQFTWSIYMACEKTNLNIAWAFFPGDNSRSFVGLASYTAPINNSQRVSITVPGDTFVTNAYSVNGMKITINLGFGSNFALPAASTAWGVGFDATVTGSYNFITDTTPPNCFFSGEQIDFGPVPLPFRNIDRQEHFARARMFKFGLSPVGVPATGAQGAGSGLTVSTNAAAAGTYTSGVYVAFPSEMNGIPIGNLTNPRVGGATGHWSGQSNAVDSGVVQPYGATTRGVTVLNNGAAGDNANQINEITGWFGACPGNTGVGTGC